MHDSLAETGERSLLPWSLPYSSSYVPSGDTRQALFYGTGHGSTFQMSAAY
jgi:hypothetical protein